MVRNFFTTELGKVTSVPILGHCAANLIVQDVQMSDVRPSDNSNVPQDNNGEGFISATDVQNSVVEKSSITPTTANSDSLHGPNTPIQANAPPLDSDLGRLDVPQANAQGGTPSGPDMLNCAGLNMPDNTLPANPMEESDSTTHLEHNEPDEREYELKQIVDVVTDAEVSRCLSHIL